MFLSMRSQGQSITCRGRKLLVQKEEGEKKGKAVFIDAKNRLQHDLSLNNLFFPFYYFIYINNKAIWQMDFLFTRGYRDQIGLSLAPVSLHHLADELKEDRILLCSYNLCNLQKLWQMTLLWLQDVDKITSPAYGRERGRLLWPRQSKSKAWTGSVGRSQGGGATGGSGLLLSAPNRLDHLYCLLPALNKHFHAALISIKKPRLCLKQTW